MASLALLTSLWLFWDGSARIDVGVDVIDDVEFVSAILFGCVAEDGAEDDDGGGGGGDVAEDPDPSSDAFSSSTSMSGPVKLAFSGPMSL